MLDVPDDWMFWLWACSRAHGKHLKNSSSINFKDKVGARVGDSFIEINSIMILSPWFDSRCATSVISIWRKGTHSPPKLFQNQVKIPNPRGRQNIWNPLLSGPVILSSINQNNIYQTMMWGYLSVKLGQSWFLWNYLQFRLVSITATSMGIA